MTISEQMQTITEKLIRCHSIGYRISSQEIKVLVATHFGTNYSSIIPSDYCYDRVNKGIDFHKKPHLFKFLGDGMYECLGKNYSFDGPVLTLEKGAKEEVQVGEWKNGHFIENENWTLCGLK